MNFDQAFDRLINHEGGYSDDPKDPGNWTGGKCGAGVLKGTKYGIAANTYGHLDIKNLTLEQAKAIYREDFWDIAGQAHPAVKFQLFDAAVNHGHANAIRILQRAVKVADDGAWGKVSQAALDAMDYQDVLLRFLGHRLKFWASLQKFDTYGRGWTNRGAENLLLAAEDN
ncbi:glycoside hydrolase family 108 protein [Rhodoferax sp.]|uniref:glycoside hydrolase family 108 protein n=1 Tax=Rhodoferax sp. TaxID=50421 RepID=UPI002ACD6C08|nr:glycosyl hydrolase 108 family protein [Rhodoferax sp.]MDZ7918526.1 glycosyl hydrolase 108 family protein [Rhodoferax sp.]